MAMQASALLRQAIEALVAEAGLGERVKVRLVTGLAFGPEGTVPRWVGEGDPAATPIPASPGEQVRWGREYIRARYPVEVPVLDQEEPVMVPASARDRALGNMMRVCDLLPGDVIGQGAQQALYVAQCRHPLWPQLQLVIWRLADQSWSLDALNIRQEVGVLASDPEVGRMDLLRRGLAYEGRWAV